MRAVALSGLLALMALGDPAYALEPSQALKHVKRAQQDARDGDITKARARLEWLLFTDIDSDARTRTYQDALRQLINQKPLSFAFSGSVLSASNVARSSTEGIFQTDIGDFTLGDTASHGFGILGAITGAYRYAYAVGRDVSISAKLSTSYYEDIALRSTTPTITVAHRWLGQGATYEASAFASKVIYPTVASRSAPDSDAVGLRFSTTQRFANEGTLFARLSLWTQHYEERDYIDGTSMAVDLTYAKPVSRRGKVTFIGGASSRNLSSESFSYGGYRLGVNYGHTTDAGFGWSLGYTRDARTYDGVFTGLSYARADDIDTFSVGVSHRDIKIGDMTPRLTCSSKRQTSNVALYTYETFDCAVALRHSF